MLTAEQLAKKMRLGQLTQEEFDSIVERVRDNPHEENLSLLIRILGRVGTSELKEIIEKFLYYPKKPYVSSVALEVLCEWGLTSDYLEVIKKFIRGEPWDVNDDVRLSAMSISGCYLAESFDQELLHSLMDIFEHLGTRPHLHETSDYARAFIKSCAYADIAQAMHSDYDSILEGEQTEEWIEKKEFHKLDQVMLQKARRLLNKQE